MLSIGSVVYGFFSPLGIAGLLLTLFIIFYFDATFVPTLPELFTVVIYMAYPVPYFGLLMVVTLSAAEFAGVTTLYVIVKRLSLPEWMRKRILAYSRFLVVPDEKIILLNRIAPVIPFLGAFIATCEWPFARSAAYNLVGGVAKYSLIIVMASSLLAVFSNESEAEVITVIAIFILIAASYLLSLYRKRRMQGKTTADA